MLIVIADDHALVRESIADAMVGLQYRNEPVEVATVGSYQELYDYRRDKEPIDLVLVDFNMPGMDGFEGIKKVVTAFTDVPVVVVSGAGGAELARGCLDAGAAGFIPKTVSMASLRNAARVVLDGEKYIHAMAMDATGPGPRSLTASRTTSAPQLPHFSEREEQIIERLIGGGTNKDIARKLDLQEMTVKTHVRNIYRKLGVPNRARAVRVILEARMSQGG